MSGRDAEALYRSMPHEGDEMRALARSQPLTMPVLAVGAGAGPFTAATIDFLHHADAVHT